MKNKENIYDLEHIARTCHEINRIYCKAHGDFSQPHWDDAPKWQKRSAVQGVNFVLENPDITSQMQHENWLSLKVAEGWKYGIKKDADKKEHPCMVPYRELPKEQQAKDTIFRNVVLSFR